jgi:PAS domain S-box-containing protein
MPTHLAAERRLRTYNQALKRLVGDPALRTGDVDSALAAVTETAARTLATRRVGVWIFSPAGEAIDCVHLYDAADGHVAPAGRLNARDFPHYFAALAGERALRIVDAQQDPRTRELVDRYLVPLGVTSMLDAPIRVRGVLRGIVCHEADEGPRRWTDDDEAFAGSIADLVGLTLEAAERHERERELRLLVSAMSEVIFVVDDRGCVGQVLATSPPPLFGDPDELCGKRLADFLAPEEADRALAAVRHTLRNGVPGVLECRIERGGRRVWLAATITQLTPTTALVVARDVTRRQEQDALFAAALRTSRDAVVVIRSEDEVVVDHNDAWLETVGLPADAVLGRPLADVVVWPADGGQDEVRAALARGDEVRDAAIGFIRQRPGMAAEERDGVLSARAVEVGGVRHVVATVRDVTEEHRATAHRLRAQRLEELGRLAGGIAHDFNNLLTAISTYAQLLQGELREGRARAEDIDEILKASDRAAALTRRLLAFSRRQPVERVEVDLNAVVDETRGLLAPLLGPSVDVELRLATDLPPIVADPGQLDQVLLNLAVNARDAMPGGGRLTIATGRATLDAAAAERLVGGAVAAGEYVTLRIGDTGVGMAPAVQSQIFQPFFTTKPAGQGTGLGLAVVYGILDQNGAGVAIESAPDAGTTFTIHWPVADPHARAARTPETPAEAHPAGGETILLVDDEQPVRVATCRLLRRLGYHTREAAHGAEALERVRADAGAIDLVLSDVMMPVLGGHALAEALAREHPELPVVLMSGFAELSESARAAPNIVGALLRKPFTVDELRDAVGRGLAARGAEETGG